MFDNINLIVEHEDAAALADKQKYNENQFALIRRNGFGASDAATLLNVSPWTGIDELIKQKASTEVTEDELKIGRMPQVRMGVDLEPFILSKFEQWAGMSCKKPKPMYRIEEFPYLTVNFDGLTEIDVPVEVKCVSMFGEGKKDNPYWLHDHALDSIDQARPSFIEPGRLNADVIKGLAKSCGIPVYYYTQCQQQILAANSTHAYLAAMHTKDWTLRVYYVPRCEAVINLLKENGYQAWKKVEKLKNKI